MEFELLGAEQRSEVAHRELTLVESIEATVQVTPHRAGETLLTIRDWAYGQSATVRVRVRKAVALDQPGVDRLEIAWAPEVLGVGARAQMGVTARDTNGQPMPWPEGQYTWISSPAGVLELLPIEASGQVGVRGLAIGTALLAVSDSVSGLTAQATVRVEPSGAPVALAFVPANIAVWPGAVRDVHVVATWGDGHTQDVTTAAELTSSNMEAAVVDSPTTVRGGASGASGDLQASLGQLRAVARVTVTGRRLLAVSSVIPTLYWDSFYQEMREGGWPITRVMDVDSGAQVATMAPGCGNFDLSAFDSRLARLFEYCRSIDPVKALFRRYDAVTLTALDDFDVFGDGIRGALDDQEGFVLDELNGLAYSTTYSSSVDSVVWDYQAQSRFVAPMGYSLRTVAFDDVTGKLLGASNRAPMGLHRFLPQTFAIEATAPLKVEDFDDFAIDPDARKVAAVTSSSAVVTAHELDLDTLAVGATFPISVPCSNQPPAPKVDRGAGRWYLPAGCEILAFDWGSTAPVARLTVPVRFGLHQFAVSVAQRRLFAFGTETYVLPTGSTAARKHPYIYVWDADSLAYLGSIHVPQGVDGIVPLP